MFRRIVVAVALIIVAGACASAPTEVIERLAEQDENITDVEIDPSNRGSIAIEFQDEEGGGSAVFGGGEIPADFPVPFPSGGEVQAVIDQATQKTATVFYGSGRFDEIAGFYENWWTSQSADIESEFETSAPKSVSWFGTIGDANFSISITDSGSQVIVNVTYGG